MPLPDRRHGPRRVRRSGRPARTGDHDPREALLDAAVALIAEHGVAGSSSADVAGRAGVTPAMVHYYFRNRELLLDAVVGERLARFPAHVFGAPLADASAAQMVTTVVERLYEAARLMPWMPPIWIREIVSDGGALRTRMLAHFPSAAVGRLAEVIARDRAAGLVAPGVEPRLAFLTLAGVAMLPLAVRSLWSKLPGLSDLDQDILQRHVLAVLQTGLVGAGGALR